MTTRPSVIRVLALAAVAAAATAGMATAQTGPLASDQPIMVGGDDFELSAQGFALTGRAEVLQGDNRLRADAIEGVGGSGGISRVTASGDVWYVTPNETIRGDRAVYAVDDATIVVTGDVILTQGRNVLTGSRLVYNIDSRAARMEGAPRGAAGRRVQGVFYPEGSAD